MSAQRGGCGVWEWVIYLGASEIGQRLLLGVRRQPEAGGWGDVSSQAALRRSAVFLSDLSGSRL